MIINSPFQIVRRLITISILFLCTTSSTDLFSQTGSRDIFIDGFNRSILGSNWQASPFWSLHNGEAYNFQDGLGGFLITTNRFKDTSFIIETEASGFTSNYRRKFHITFGGTSDRSDSMYVLTYDPDFGSRLILSVSSTNRFEATVLDEAGVYPKLNSTSNYRFKIAKYKSGLIQVYLDNGKGFDITPILETIDTTYSNLGHFGWREDTEGYPEGFYVNWIKATKPVSEKSVKEKPVEDQLITQVSAVSGKSYKVAKLTSGVKLYTDRDYLVQSVPSYLEGASFIQTANDDKYKTANTFLTAFYKKSVVVYVGYDPRSKTIPAWLSTWTKTTDRINTTDPGTSYLNVYSKVLDSWEVYPMPNTVGANLANPASGAITNYIIAAVEKPGNKNLEAEEASISGAVKSRNHTGYQGTGFVDFLHSSNDFIEWNVQIDVPGTYTLGFTYSNGSNSDRSLELTNDGKKVNMLQFIPTGSWNNWAFLSGAQVYLSAGVHKIRTTVAGNHGPNMDQLSLSYYSASPPSTEQFNKLAAIQIVPPTASANGTYKIYPNPFRESTTIEYTIEKQSHVILTIYSSLGQQLQVLVNSVQQPGTYRGIYRLQNFSAGLYYYKLQIGDKVHVGKLIKAQ